MAKNTFLVEVTFNDATRTVILVDMCNLKLIISVFALNKDMKREIKFEMSLKDIPMGLGVQSEFTELFGRIYLN